MTEDEMSRWHHQLNGHEFEQTPRYSEGQGGPACPAGHLALTFLNINESVMLRLLEKAKKSSPVVVIQSLSCVQFFVTPWTSALQAPLSFTISEFAQTHVH